MKIRTNKAAVFLAGAFCSIIGLALLARRPNAETPNTAHSLGFTNGLVGIMATTYQTFSTNTAATIQRWLHDGTNAVLLRVTNNQSYGICLFPFARIQTNTQSSGGYESILLNAPNFSGVCLPAGQATNVQVLVFAPNGPWRVELRYTRIPDGSFVERLRNLPRDLRALATRQGIIQHTTAIPTEWIQP